MAAGVRHLVVVQGDQLDAGAAMMNLKLLDPRTIVRAAEQAYAGSRAPLASVEGSIRQILDWREYVRGVYWLLMPGYLDRNALEAHEPLPSFYWDGATSLACLRAVIRQTLDLGDAHRRHFFAHHRAWLETSPRLALAGKNLDRFSAAELAASPRRAADIRAHGGQPPKEERGFSPGV